MKKFDFCCGNPAYNSDFSESGLNGNFASPVYDKFLDAAYEVADVVEMIHPARFLYNAGSTPKAWNQKMLSDPHFKVLFYEQNSSAVFPGTDIKGGVAISYRNKNENYGAIKTFTPFAEVHHIMKKVCSYNDFSSLSDVMENQTKFNLENLFNEHPEYKSIIGSDGKDKRFRNNIFDKIPAFTEDKVNANDIKVIGVVSNKRTYRYIPERYVDKTSVNLRKWKVLVVRVNGTGALGEVLSKPLISAKNEGYTQTFIGIGAFNNKEEAENCLKYVKSKFSRTLLSVLKITQDNSIETWKCIPLQDFTSDSDIDWSKSISEIDQQLYKKYGLTQEEIDFVESHVKEMEQHDQSRCFPCRTYFPSDHAQ